MSHPLPPNAPLRLSKRIIRQDPGSRSSFFSLSVSTSRVTAQANMGTIIPPAKPLLFSTWNTVGRTGFKLTSSWNTRVTLTAQKSSQFRVTNHVVKSAASSWTVEKRISLLKPVRYNAFYKATGFSTSRFNTHSLVSVKGWSVLPASPGAISTGIVHPIDFTYPSARRTYYSLSSPTVMPIDWQLNTDTGQTVQPGIQFRVGINPNGRVQCTKQMSFNVMNTVSSVRSMNWKVIYRYGIATPMQFNVYNNLSKGLVIQWIVGPRVPGNIRQLAQVRTDFAY